MPTAGRVETEREAQHRDEVYDRWKDKEIMRERTIIDVWQNIDHQEYGTEWTTEQVHRFQDDLRRVFEPADDGEDWSKVWNFAVSTIEAFKTNNYGFNCESEKVFYAWQKFIADIVLNYYYYFWDFDVLEGCDITHTPVNV